MNCGLDGYQPSEAVLETRRRLAHSVCGRDLPLAILRQVHSDDVFKASRSMLSDPPRGDGWVAGQPELLVAIQTADCLPVLLADPVQRVVAAVHAGWRGTLLGIAPKAVRVMQTEFGSRPSDCLAIVGPAIRKCCYEVGEEVVEAFSKQFEHASDLFGEPPRGKATRSRSRCLDLPEACRRQLLDAGIAVENVFAGGPCTACEKDRFFSHRAEAGQTGRMMSMIGMVEEK
ncbi:MAG: peptidoglycan editing factor PgeF [Acidobacteria bacterium]|nr:peptidoglycan editing factor PgeF [Acidobacteriota bacterium]